MPTTMGHESLPQGKVFNPRDVMHCPGCGSPMIASPVFKCADCDKNHYVRSFYYKRGDGYAAECIDLSLMSIGATPEEAIGSLQEAMIGYLQVAFEGDAKGLVMRPSPIPRRLHYHCHRLLQRIKHLFEAGHRDCTASPRTFTFCE